MHCHYIVIQIVDILICPTCVLLHLRCLTTYPSLVLARVHYVLLVLVTALSIVFIGIFPHHAINEWSPYSFVKMLASGHTIKLINIGTNTCPFYPGLDHLDIANEITAYNVTNETTAYNVTNENNITNEINI